jgi:urease accessory protein
MLRLLHLCDSLFPIGGYAYSDGLESATGSGAIRDQRGLQAWLDVTLDETIGRLEGPCVWRSHAEFDEERWDELALLDEELAAFRPSSGARRSSRAMGSRLLITWRRLHPDARLERLQEIAEAAPPGPALPIAFAAACASARVSRRDAVEAFAYTRLNAGVSAAMRLMPIGQTEAHLLLACLLERVPAVVNLIVDRQTGGHAVPESFTPAADVAAMTQQYLHSRLFRS